MAKLNINLKNIGSTIPAVHGLHFGCGGAWKHLWLNTDIEEFEGQNGVKTSPGSIFSFTGYEHNEFYYIQHNAKNAFPFPDNFFRNCYSEHFIEHVTRFDALRLLREIHRVMRPCGILRISTPDLFEVTSNYLDPDYKTPPKVLEFLEKSVPSHFTFNRAFMINNTFKLWGHQWIYDLEDLTLLLTEAGFQQEDVKKCEFREGRIACVETLDMVERRDHSSLYVEVEKR